MMIFLMVWNHLESSGVDFDGFQNFQSLIILVFGDRRLAIGDGRSAISDGRLAVGGRRSAVGGRCLSLVDPGSLLGIGGTTLVDTSALSTLEGRSADSCDL